MGYSTWILDVVHDEFRGDKDVPVTGYPGWETRGRDSANHQGVLDHHMGAPPNSRFDSNGRYIAEGPRFPPLANIATASPFAPDVDLVCPIVIISAGRANHAGEGSLAWMPQDQGNPLMIGIEHYSTYIDTGWHPRHLEIQLRLDACLLEHMGQSWARRADHKEYAPARKTDRHHIDTAAWDRDLRDLMAARARGEQPVIITPAPPTPPEEDIMATLDDVRAAVRQEIRHELTERPTVGPRSISSALRRIVATQNEEEPLTRDDVRELIGDAGITPVTIAEALDRARDRNSAQDIFDELVKRLAE